ncbi:hypothetical protein KRR38_10880 [Novosphingobium sp. G106]|nr:hypothetical protein [Novosphingobium sp. G106]
MSVRITDDAIYLEGRCMVEEAETLLAAIQQCPETPIDVSGLQRLHMAVAQVLLALKPTIRGEPPDLFLAQRIFGDGLDGDKTPEPA